MVALAVLGGEGIAAAREVTVSRQSGYPLAIQPLQGSSGSSALGIVQSDLRNSGFFNFVPAGPGAFIAAGTSSGGRIDATLNAPDGRQLFSRSYGGPSLKRNAHRFADDIVFAITGKPGIASGTIAFVSNKTGHKEIYLCDYDGGDLRQITSDQAICVAPSISADGASLTYTGYRSGYADVYSIDLVSGGRRRIVDAPGTNSGAEISPDGRRIALTMSFTGNTELYVTGIGGGRGKRLTHTPGVEASPTWSPDGRELVFTSDASGSPELYRISASGGRPSKIPVGYRHATEPSWSPDGNRLAFNVLTGGSQVVAVYEFGSRGARLVTSGASAENPSWGADSRHLVYAQSGNLVLQDVDAGTTTTVLSGVGRISEPSWTH
ncbi:Tol-Pal system beta propeller repeat protein TolB [soil metagenome]